MSQDCQANSGHSVTTTLNALKLLMTAAMMDTSSPIEVKPYQ